MTEGIFADIKMIKFGATSKEIDTFLKEIKNELNTFGKRLSKVSAKAKKDIDEYLEDTANEKVRKLINHTYEDTKASVENNIYRAKELIADIDRWYNGKVESAELWTFCEINETEAKVANIKIQLEFLENIVDNVKKMMDEAKAKSENLGVKYIEGYTCVPEDLSTETYPEV